MSDRVRNLEKKYECIRKLESADICFEEIISVDPILDILGVFDVDGIVRIALHRWYKWYFKRGIQLESNPTASISLRALRGFFRKAFLEAVHREILGYYGVSAADVLHYTTLGNKAAKLTLQYRGKTLANLLKDYINIWKIKYNIDETIGKVIVLASAKTTIYLLRNGDELLKPVIYNIKESYAKPEQKTSSNVKFGDDKIKKKDLGSDRREYIENNALSRVV